MDNERHWYIAIVAPNTERVAAEILGRELEVYLPSQRTVSVWKDGRRKFRDVIAIPGKLLVHCTERQRLASCDISYVKRYLVDIAGALNEFGRHPVAIVPDDQVQTLKFVLGQQDAKVEMANGEVREGDRVRVVNGSLLGLEGIVSEVRGADNARIFINIEHLGCAVVEVPRGDIEIVTAMA